MKKNYPQHIAVAGNIGAGKTTLVRKLASHFGWKEHLEVVEGNPYLEDFYEDMTSWAFPTQIYFLQTRFRQISEIQRSKHTVIQDRTIYEDAHIFAKNLRESGYLSERDYLNYLGLFETMAQFVRPPDLMIYMKASIGTLIERISKRGRKFESSISIRYLEDLNRNYENWIGKYQDGPLLVLNVDKLDILHRPEDWGQVIRRVDAQLYGLF